MAQLWYQKYQARESKVPGRRERNVHAQRYRDHLAPTGYYGEIGPRQAERLGAAIRLWFVLREAKQIAHQDNDRDLSDCRHIYRGLFLDIRIEVLW